MQLGVLTPDMQPTQELRTGQVGYVVTGLKSIKAARVGDTWHHHKATPEPLPGFRPAKAMMFAGAHYLYQLHRRSNEPAVCAAKTLPTHTRTWQMRTLL